MFFGGIFLELFDPVPQFMNFKRQDGVAGRQLHRNAQKILRCEVEPQTKQAYQLRFPPGNLFVVTGVDFAGAQPSVDFSRHRDRRSRLRGGEDVRGGREGLDFPLPSVAPGKRGQSADSQDNGHGSPQVHTLGKMLA